MAWVDTADLEMTTRTGFEQYIRSKIRPALGDVQVRRITVEVLDRFLRRAAQARRQEGSAPRVDDRPPDPLHHPRRPQPGREVGVDR
jgi:hypothetical protein